MRIGSASSDSSNVFEVLASDTVFYEVYPDEIMYRNQKLVYDLIDKGAIVTTSALEDFYALQQNGNMAGFADVDNALATNDYNSAVAINSTIASANQVEYYQQRINALLLKYLQHETPASTTGSVTISVLNKAPLFNEAELAELWQIANSCLDQYGSVVTQARVLLNQVTGIVNEFEDNCNPELNRRKPKQSGITNQNVRVFTLLYPNPNNGDMTLEYDLGVENRAEMRIFDITGKVVCSYKLSQPTGKTIISEQQLRNGVYYYNILINDKVIKTDKIIIIK